MRTSIYLSPFVLVNFKTEHDCPIFSSKSRLDPEDLFNTRSPKKA